MNIHILASFKWFSKADLTERLKTSWKGWSAWKTRFCQVTRKRSIFPSSEICSFPLTKTALNRHITTIWEIIKLSKAKIISKWAIKISKYWGNLCCAVSRKRKEIRFMGGRFQIKGLVGEVWVEWENLWSQKKRNWSGGRPIRGVKTWTIAFRRIGTWEMFT